MPLKLYYNGSATLYAEPSDDCLKALERARERRRIPDESLLSSIHREAREDSQAQDRHFRLKHHNRQQIISSGIYGHDTKDNNILFLTLTYPASKFTHEDPEKSSNEPVKRYLNNLRTNYGMKGYAWVKELTKIGTPHYHLLADLPFIKIEKLNSMWEKNAGIHSNNCVTHDEENGLVVDSPERAGFYVAKYISKMKGETMFDKRVYAISNSWQIKPMNITDTDIIRELLTGSKNHFKGDYSTTMQIDRDITQIMFADHPEFIDNQMINLTK